MATYIYAGGTPILRFKPLNGIRVDDASLGSPSIFVSQEDRFFTYEGAQLTIDAVSNTVSCKMPEADTILLVDGVQTQAQLVFANSTTMDVVRFPVHDLTVLPSLADAIVTPEYIPEDESGLDPDGEPYAEEETVLVDGDATEGDEDWVYDLENWSDDSTNTLEPDPEQLYDIDDV